MQNPKHVFVCMWQGSMVSNELGLDRIVKNRDMWIMVSAFIKIGEEQLIIFWFWKETIY